MSWKVLETALSHLKQNMQINVLNRFIEICMETPRWSPSVWAPTWRLETNRNICHLVLLRKEELKNIKIDFLTNELFPDVTQFLTNLTALPAVM